MGYIGKKPAQVDVSLSTGSITAVEMAANSVLASEIAENAIGSSELANNAVTATHIPDNTITATHIPDGLIAATHLAADLITGAKIADDAIDSEHYTDGSIDTVHIADDAITAAKLPDDVIDSEHYAAGSIDTAHIADLNVTTAKIANNAITAAKLPDNVITATHIPNLGIAGSHIADDAIDSNHYADGSIDLVHMSANSVDSDQYVDGSIDLVHMSANSVDSDQYVDGSIDAAHLADDAVTSAKLDTNIAIDGTLGVTGVISPTTHIDMPDNAYLKIGTHDDLLIYHDASHSYIEDDGDGDLRLKGSTVRLQGTGGTNHLVGITSGATTLYHNNAAKLATASGGATVTGTLTATTLAGTLSTAAQTNITSLGTLTTLTVDDITINGSTISDAGNFTLDVEGDINFDANGSDITLLDGGTEFGRFKQVSNGMRIATTASNADMTFYVNDDGSEFTALTLDMSAAGAANFNSTISLGGTTSRTLGPVTGSLGTLQVSGSGAGGYEGLAIDGRVVLMHDGGNITGLYNDVDDEWLFRADFNGESKLYYNGLEKLKTVTGGITVTGEITTTASQFRYVSNTDSNVGLLIRDETYVSDEADITATRLASGSNLTLGLAGQNGINYYVGGSNVASLNSSGNATFAGTLTSSGAINVTNGLATFTTASSWGAGLTIKQTNDDASPAYLRLQKDPASGYSTMADGDYIGFINMRAFDDAGNAHTYVELAGVATDVSNGAETSKFTINTWGAGTEYGTNLVVTGGKVGIGTSTPAAALEVSRGSAGYAGIFGAPQGSGRVILFKDNHASPNKYNWLVGSQYTINHGFEITPSTAIGGTTFSNPAISILYTGNVGIGTESPTMPLSVQAASNAYAISMHGRSDGYSELYGASNDGSTKYSFLQSHSAQTKLYTLVNTPLLFGTNSTERMRLSAAGDLQLESGAANKGYIQLSTQATSYALMGGNHWGYMGYKTGGYHRWFGSDGAEDMRIDSSGKVLIGDNASHTTDLLQIETPASGGGHGIQIRRNDANSDQVIGHVMFGNNTATDLAKISAKTDGDSNSGDSGALAFHTQVTGGALTERLRLTSTGEVWCPEKGNNGDYTMYIGSCNAVSNGNSYLHVNLDMPGSDMFWIEVIGYDYVAKSIYGRAGGYMYNFTNQTSVYSGVYNGDIDAAYMNTNGDLELAIATGYSGTSNRWGSVVLRGGHDTISATGPIKIKEYSYTANTDQVYQV